MDNEEKITALQMVQIVVTKEKSIPDLIEAMKSLRNSIGKNPNLVQTLILEKEDGVLESCEWVVEKFNTNKHNKFEGYSVEQFRILWQFLYNLCIGQPVFCQKLWKKFQPSVIGLLGSESDAKLLNVLSAIILLVVKDDDSMYSKDASKTVLLIQTILQLIIQDEKGELEFPVIVLQNILRGSLNKGFNIELIYPDLNYQQRFVLLDIIAEEKHENLNKQVVSFLIQTFKNQADLLMTVLEKRQEVSEPKEVLKILNILGCASYLKEWMPMVQNDKSLLISSVYLLRMVHDAGKENKSNIFSVVKNMEHIADREKMETDPVFGFKRDLVRLIGNLCYEHKENQDQVRTQIYRVSKF